jgi:hypothetical protein
LLLVALSFFLATMENPARTPLGGQIFGESLGPGSGIGIRGDILFFHFLQQGGAVEVKKLGRLAFHPVALAQGFKDQVTLK